MSFPSHLTKSFKHNTQSDILTISGGSRFDSYLYDPYTWRYLATVSRRGECSLCPITGEQVSTAQLKGPHLMSGVILQRTLCSAAPALIDQSLSNGMLRYAQQGLNTSSFTHYTSCNVESPIEFRTQRTQKSFPVCMPKPVELFQTSHQEQASGNPTHQMTCELTRNKRLRKTNVLFESQRTSWRVLSMVANYLHCQQSIPIGHISTRMT